MSRYKIPNEPTLGRGKWLTRDKPEVAEAEQEKPDPEDRSFAQPLPGSDADKQVEEKKEATDDEKAQAMTDKSEAGKTYVADDVREEPISGGAAKLLAEAGIAEEISPGPLVPANDTEVSDEDLDGIDPTA